MTSTIQSQPVLGTAQNQRLAADIPDDLDAWSTLEGFQDRRDTWELDTCCPLNRFALLWVRPVVISVPNELS